MSGLQRAAARVRYFLGAVVGASLMVSQVHPDAIGAQAIHGRLVRMDPLPPDVCVRPAAVQWAEQAGRQGRRASTQPLDDQTKIFAGPPARKVQDRYAAFAAVSVDPIRDEVILTDENLFQVLAYNRLDNTPADAITAPKRVLTGSNTLIEFESGVHVDPASGDIFAPNNDTVDTLVVFRHGSTGDSAPIRALKTPHGTFGIAVDDRRNEMFLTTQHDATVVVFRKNADQDDAPLRLLQGDDTGLGDPHGIAIDPAKDVFYVANYGSHALRRADREIRTGVPGSGKGRDKANWPFGREYAVPGSGTNDGPSISDPCDHGQGERQTAPRHQGSEDTIELADRPGLRRRAPRALRRQRHGTVDPGLRRGRRWQRDAQARPEGSGHRPRAPDVGLARHEERRALGGEFRRPLGDGLSDRRIGRHQTAPDDPKRAGIGALADDRQSRSAHL